MRRDIEPEMVKKHPIGNGIQKLYRFSNGFGADDDIESFGLTYDTPITDDVMGHIVEDKLQVILEHIKQLNKSGDYRGKGTPLNLGEY